MSKNPQVPMPLVPASALTGDALEYAAAVAQGLKPRVLDGRPYGGGLQVMIPVGRNGSAWYQPDIEEIIQDRQMSVRFNRSTIEWEAWIVDVSANGHTLREAVLRCFVLAKLVGTEVPIPPALVGNANG